MRRTKRQGQLWWGVLQADNELAHVRATGDATAVEAAEIAVRKAEAIYREGMGR